MAVRILPGASIPDPVSPWAEGLMAFYRSGIAGCWHVGWEQLPVGIVGKHAETAD